MATESGTRHERSFRMVEADLIRELVVAFLAVTVLVVVVAALLSSPDERTFTAAQLAAKDPAALETTALQWLNGEDDIASYGPPYNHQTGSLQNLGFFAPQSWFGVTIPVDPARDFFLHPLERMRALDPALPSALKAWNDASPTRRGGWETAYGHALKVTGGARLTALRFSGPLPTLMKAYLSLARSGALEAIINADGRVYQTDFTDALLPLQGDPLQTKAGDEKLLGTQWGMMKEPGNYPGAVWLWFYTLLYQIPPYNTSSSGDLLAGLTVGVVTILLLLIPWIPGLRDIPRWVRIYRLIWKDHYARRD